MKRRGKTLLKQDLLVSAALTALILIIYLQSVRFDFIGYDDPRIFSENPNVQGGLTWEGIKWAFTNPNFGLYMPLPTLSFMLDVTLFGAWPGGYHLHNVLWHIAAVLTFYRLLLHLTGRRFESAFAALLLAVHPVNTMVVNWVSARNEIMPAWFGLAAIACHVRYVRRQSRTAYAGIALFMFLGILGKQTQVMVPVILLLLDFWPLDRIRVFPFQWPRLLKDLSRLVMEKVPLFALSALGMVFAFWGKLSVHAFDANLATTPMENMGNAIVSYARYLAHLLYPVNLSFHYPLLGDGLTPLLVLGSGALLITVTVAALAALRRGYIAAGWFWFLSALLPVSGIVGFANSSIALRYLYFPALGLYLLTAFAWGDMVASFSTTPAPAVGKAKKSPPPKAASGIGRRLPWAAPAIVVLVFVPLSFWQTTFWRNTESLTLRSLAVMDGSNAMAHNQLAGIRRQQGLREQALYHTQRAYELEPEIALWQYNYAIELLRRDRHAEVESMLRESIHNNPTNGPIRAQYAFALLGLGRYEAAVPHFEQAIALTPNNVPAYTNYARCLIALERYADADRILDAALKIAPRHSAALMLRRQIQPFLTGAGSASP